MFVDEKGALGYLGCSVYSRHAVSMLLSVSPGARLRPLVIKLLCDGHHIFHPGYRMFQATLPR